jgi:multiple sugar transport system substrate-binding protein
MKCRIIWGAVFAAIITAAAAVPAMAQQVTIKLWLHEHPPRLPIDKQIIADFEKANPDIAIQYEVIAASEYATKLLTAFASGAGPDLFNQFSGLVAQYYNSRILAPIDYDATGFGDEKGFTGHFFSGLDGIRFAGKYYGIPTEVSNYACYANNALWKEAGLDPNKDFPKTWEAFPAVAEKLTKRDANGVPIRRGFDFNWPNRAYLYLAVSTMLHQRGSNLIDDPFSLFSRKVRLQQDPRCSDGRQPFVPRNDGQRQFLLNGFNPLEDGIRLFSQRSIHVFGKADHDLLDFELMNDLA